MLRTFAPKMSAVFFILGLTAHFSSASIQKPPSLDPAEKSRLRYKLESLFNEADLLIQNKSADASDVQRQQKEAEILKMYERIPFEEKIPDLRAQLEESAKHFGLRLSAFRILHKDGPAEKPPASVYTDASPFRLKPEQVVRKIRFEATVHGSREQIEKWMKSWPEDQMRLTEPEKSSPLIRKKPDLWGVRAHAFQFRKETRFPRLKLRDPMHFLPAWAKRDPKEFALQEPLLWSFVTRTKELAPKAEKLYENKQQFLLNRARFEFFVSKAVPRR